jgi:D-hydroxyproline dehydrogenase
MTHGFQTERPDPDTLVVVGGGIIGLSCALKLLLAGESVLVLDADAGTPPPSWGNAGHLATECVEPLASWRTLREVPARLYSLGGALAFRPWDLPAWLPFSTRFIAACGEARFRSGTAALTALMAEAMPAWKRLAAALGDPDLVRDHGHWVVFESERRFKRAATSVGPIGAGHAHCRPLEPARLDELRGRLRLPLAGGYAYVGTGQVRRPADVLEALRARILDLGGGIRSGRATRLSPAPRGHRLLLEDGTTLEASRLLIAAGARSATLMEDAGHRTPLIAERGYHIEAETGDWADFPSLVFEDRSVVVTRFGARLRATSFVEFSRPDSAPDPGKWQRLRRHVEALGVPLIGPVATWSGPRPTLPDYLPAIGTSRRHAGLAYAFGHQHLGLTLAARTAELVAGLLQQPAREAQLSAFDIERFAR